MKKFVVRCLLVSCLLAAFSIATLALLTAFSAQETASPNSSPGTAYSVQGAPSAVGARRTAQATPTEGNWYRGQLHIHTNWTPIDDAVSWYRYHGYAFVVITDLNEPTPVEGVKALFDNPGKFLVIPGVELSVPPRGKFFDTLSLGGDPVKAWDAWRVQMPAFSDVPPEAAADILDRQARTINDAGGLPVAAHPNFNWSYTHSDLLKTDSKMVRHFELRNAEHGMNDLGGGGRPSTEEMWDAVLSTGRVLYAVATDDSHHFDDFGTQDFFADGKRYVQAKALPGRTSIFVRAPELTTKAILRAIERGDFYSVAHFTNLPIEFVSYDVDENGIQLKLPELSKDKGNTRPGENTTRYRTYFVGQGGKVLKLDESYTPSYRFQGDELYVRVRVEDSDGGVAWTQPVFPG